MGAVVVERGGWLSVRVSWRGRRWSESTGVRVDDPEAAAVRRIAAQLDALIKSGGFDEAQYARFFPRGNRMTEFAGIAPAQRIPTLGEYAAGWLTRKKGAVRIAQFRCYKTHLRKVLAIELDDGRKLAAMRLDLVRTSMLDAARAAWVRAGASQKYARNVLCGTLQALFRDAIADKLATDNPCAALRWPRTTRRDADPFTEAERDAILNRMARRHPHYYPFVEVLFGTGMRPSEAAGLRWGDVDLAAGVAYVRRSQVEGRVGETKTAASQRAVALLPDTALILRGAMPLHAGEDTPVFTGPRGSAFCQRRFAERQWRQVLRGLGIRPRRLYDTRATYVSLSLSAGVNLFWLARQVGTSVAMIEARYGRFMPDAGQAELMRVAETYSRSRGENGASVAQRPKRGR